MGLQEGPRPFNLHTGRHIRLAIQSYAGKRSVAAVGAGW